MPSRLIREGILTSDRVDRLSPPAEVFYRRLMSKVDDHGLFDARVPVLLSALYPLRLDPDHPHATTAADVKAWLGECTDAGLVETYAVAGKPFLRMLDTRWPARSEPRHPTPPSGQPFATVNNCKQPSTTVLLDVVVDVGVGVEKDVGVVVARSALAEIGVTPATFEAWERHRAAIRKPLTADAVRLQVKHLTEWAAAGHDPTAIIETAISNRWQGLFKPKTDAPSRAPPGGRQKGATVDAVIAKGNKGGTNERVIEGTAERVGRGAVRALPGNLRE